MVFGIERGWIFFQTLFYVCNRRFSFVQMIFLQQCNEVFHCLIAILSIPIWSLCFGWIYVKFTNWLNHFPVLGKKVF